MEVRTDSRVQISVVKDDNLVDNVDILSPFPFEKLILYLPMWTTRLPSQEKRSLYISWFTIFCTAIFITFYCVYGVLANIRIYDHLTFGICYAARLILFSVARFYSIYYFAKHFSYPWRSQIITELNQIKPIKHFRYMYITLVLIFIFDSIFIVVNCLTLSANMVITDYVVVVLGKILLYFPIYVTVGIHAAICITYYLYLSELVRILQREDDFSVKYTFDLYRKLYESFSITNNVHLKWCINLSAMACVVHLWGATYQLFDGDNYGAAMYGTVILSLLMLYVIPSSILSETYYKFEDELWKHGNDIMSNVNNDHHELQQFNYLLQYIMKHTMIIKIGKLTVTRRNFVQFVIIFVILKILAYSMRWIIQ